MPIRFPDIDDVTLTAPPLTEVICQVRFTPILEISEGMPTDFHKLLRARFPKFARRSVLRIEIAGGSTPPGIPLPNEFIFESADELTNVALGVEFVALSTKRYSHWGAFASDLAMVLHAFEEVYGQMQTTRIGLRYINSLNYENTHTTTPNDLVEFLNPALTHFFYNPMWSPPQNTTSAIVMRDDGEALTLRTGIDMTVRPQIVLDYDYFSEPGSPTLISQGHLLETLRRYHQRIYNAFRWSITDRSIEVFRPMNREAE